MLITWGSPPSKTKSERKHPIYTEGNTKERSGMKYLKVRSYEVSVIELLLCFLWCFPHIFFNRSIIFSRENFVKNVVFCGNYFDNFFILASYFNFKYSYS